MIDQSQEILMSLLAYSFILGVLLGMVYDVIRFVKMLFGVRYGREADKMRTCGALTVFLFVLTFIFDFLFCILISVVAVSLTYSMSGGVFRGMVYIGLFGGLILYYFTLGKLILKINARLTGFIKKLLVKIAKIVFVPIKGVFFLLVKCYRLTIGRIVGKIRMMAEKKRLKKEELLKNKSAERDLLPESGGEEEKDADTRERYPKPDRISFGQRYTDSRYK